MRLRQLSGILLLVLSAMPQVAVGKPEAPLEPIGPWKLASKFERCSLSRKFGSEGNPVHFQIDSYGSRVQFRVEISGSSVPLARTVTGVIAYRLTPDLSYREKIHYLQGTSANGRAVWLSMVFLPPELWERKFDKLSQEDVFALVAQPDTILPDFEKAVDEITLRMKFGKTLRLQLGSMAEPLETLRNCVDDLRKSWGLDPVQQKSLSRSPIPDLQSVREMQRSYPPKMIKEFRNAFVPVRIMVDEQGNAIDCVVQRPNVSDEFKRATCDGLASHFKPALDAAGRPVASVYGANVVFTTSF